MPMRNWWWYSETARAWSVGWDFAGRSRTWFPVYLSCLVTPQVRPGDVVSVYLANAKSPVYIDHLETRWLTAVN
jgi:hypothetical protein